MPKETYKEKRFSAASLGIIETANAIIAEYQAEGYDLTLRQLFRMPKTIRWFSLLHTMIQLFAFFDYRTRQSCATPALPVRLCKLKCYVSFFAFDQQIGPYCIKNSDSLQRCYPPVISVVIMLMSLYGYATRFECIAQPFGYVSLADSYFHVEAVRRIDTPSPPRPLFGNRQTTFSVDKSSGISYIGGCNRFRHRIRIFPRHSALLVSSIIGLYHTKDVNASA